VKVLRALQEGEIRRVGSDETRKVDVRVVAATNVDLRKKIQGGSFRQDLFYRLSVVEIELPPLRERLEDIPLLAYHLLQKHVDPKTSEVCRLTPEALSELARRRWEGNVRELENAIQHAVVFCRGKAIAPQDLPSEPDAAVSSRIGRGQDGVYAIMRALADLPYRTAKDKALEQFESVYFDTLLARTGGNVSEAARQAGLDRSNFRRALRRARSRSEGLPEVRYDSAENQGISASAEAVVISHLEETRAPVPAEAVPGGTTTDTRPVSSATQHRANPQDLSS
ncbi:MAG: sigma 54-interacting transcriptional regulator, partial [Polyangiaceae bacterium]|nr:sigma 54-interacting transcriptional regulator [Polyangiaceae bacterium]